jgi:hypothetical protein
LHALPTEERDVIRNVALWLALAVAQPVLAQTAPTAAPNPSPTKPSPTKLLPTKPSSTKSSPTKPTPAKPVAKKPEPPKPDAAVQSGPCGIGVITHIGESFAVQSVGLTMFGNDLKQVPIESWGLDDLVVARVRAAAGPRFTVRRIAYPANAFEAYEKFHLTLNADNELKEVVQTIAGGSGCGRYVLVIKSGSPFGATNQAVAGIGIVDSPRVFGLSRTYLFAMTALFVFDGQTFEVIKKGRGSTEVGNPLLNDLLGMNPLRGPNREYKDFPWPPAPDAVTALRDPTRALLAASLDKVLPELLAP